MEKKSPPVPVRIAFVVIALGALAYFGYTSLNASSNGQITASGSIEAAIVNVAPELAGKVSTVDVEEGQLVKATDPLLQFDATLLSAAGRCGCQS